jgi:Tfp pilus assembly protein FimV
MVALSLAAVVHAQAAQTTYTLNLNYFTVQMTYPSQVNPGDTMTVNMQANAKNSFSSASLTAQIFYVDGNSIRQLTSATVSNNGYMNSGSSLSKQITFTVPQNAPRTSLAASVTENVQSTYASYNYYPAYYNSSSPYCYYSPDYYYYYYGYCNYSYTYYPYSYSYYSYPSYVSSTASDSGVAPLSYIKAQTPEYTALQSQYQTAEQQLNQSQAQNQQLQQQLQNAQNTIAQRDTAIANLNQQLSSNQSKNTTLEAAAGGLGVLAIILGAFAVHYRGKSQPQPQPSNTQTQQTKSK